MKRTAWMIVWVLGAVAFAGQPAVKDRGRLPTQRVTVTLTGGARITADLLRQNAESVVLDLGYDVLLVPTGRLEERRVGKECRSRWSPYH